MKNIQTIATLDLSTVVGGLFVETTGNTALDKANSLSLEKGEALCRQFASKGRMDACTFQAHQPLFKTHPKQVDLPPVLDTTTLQPR
jgi:hypothetical protein